MLMLHVSMLSDMASYTWIDYISMKQMVYTLQATVPRRNIRLQDYRCQTRGDMVPFLSRDKYTPKIESLCIGSVTINLRKRPSNAVDTSAKRYHVSLVCIVYSPQDGLVRLLKPLEPSKPQSCANGRIELVIASA